MIERSTSGPIKGGLDDQAAAPSGGRVIRLADRRPVPRRPDPPRGRREALVVKRGVDLVGSAVGLALIALFLGAVAALIAAVDGRPVLYRQPRAGVGGRPFMIVKFRTMRRGADAERESLRDQNEIAGAAFKMTNDPRMTRLGRVLRRTSVDELPQLWNVLTGDMSLVGPRPHPFDDIARYRPWHFERLDMKPGITGIWQVSSRREADFDQGVELDLQYVRHWSPWLDTRLLLQTIPAVLRAQGR